MNPIQSNTSDHALIDAIRLNMSDFFRHMSRSDPEEHLEDERFIRWHSPIPHPWFNGILASSTPVEEDEEFIREVIRYFRAKETHTFTWWMEPPLQPSDWEPALTKQGFGFSTDTPGMAADLHALDGTRSHVDGLEIRLVKDADTLRTWAAVFTRGYGLPVEWSDMIFDTWIKLGLDHPLRNYLGYLNGKPVSTSSLFLGGGAAGIYDVATLPEARSRGIGAALTLHPLMEAREAGYRIGILQSSEMGFKVYQGLGFRHLCQIEHFYLSL